MTTRSSYSPSLWRHHDFVLLLSGRIVSQLGDQVQFLALPLLVVSITGSPAQAGIVFGLQTVSYLVFGLAAGALVDRWDRKTTMVWCELARAALTASVPLALLLGTLGMPQLYLVSILSGLLSTLFAAASTSALPNVVRADRLADALGAFAAVGNGFRVAGAWLAGVAYVVGAAVPFAVNAASFLVSAATTRAIRAPFQKAQTERPAATPSALVHEIGLGLNWIRRTPVVRTLTLLDAGDGLRFGAGYLLIIVLAQRLGATPIQVGLIFSGAGGGALLGSVLAPALTRRFPLGRLSVTMLWTEALAFPLYALAGAWWLLLLVAFAESVVSPIYTVALDSYRLNITPDDMRGRVSSAIGTLTTTASGAGAALSGVAITALGAPALTWILTAWLVLLAVIATTSRTVRDADMTV
jgi:MFS family permease